MLIEKMDLRGDGRVILTAYIQRWTTVAGVYPQRAGVIVLPGGGYQFHGVSEGEPVALAFAARGFNAYLLRYSIGKEYAAFPNSAAEACMALKAIRSKSSEYHQDPDKLALCGFSAGGHVAACAGTMWNRPDIREASSCSGEEGKPNALILGYPCITVDWAGQGDMYEILRGDKSREELKDIASAEKWVSSQTPPVFLWNMYGDSIVPVEHGLALENSLAQADVPFEVHTYMKGNHASALCTPATSLGSQLRENKHTARWMDDCCLWLEELFDCPVLPAQQSEMISLQSGRAHLGVPAFQMPSGEE